MQARSTLRREANQQSSIRLGWASLAASIRHASATFVESPNSHRELPQCQQMSAPDHNASRCRAMLLSSTRCCSDPTVLDVLF
jgi:hypothetical protein